MRGIYPLLATITADGFAYVDEASVAERFAAQTERLSAAASTTVVGPAPTAEGSDRTAH